jgi:hypothetical protein
MIENFREYMPLRQSPELFRQVRVGQYGTEIVWTDEIDTAADTSWRLLLGAGPACDRPCGGAGGKSPGNGLIRLGRVG